MQKNKEDTATQGTKWSDSTGIEASHIRSSENFTDIGGKRVRDVENKLEIVEMNEVEKTMKITM